MIIPENGSKLPPVDTDASEMLVMLQVLCMSPTARWYPRKAERHSWFQHVPGDHYGVTVGTSRGSAGRSPS